MNNFDTSKQPNGTEVDVEESDKATNCKGKGDALFWETIVLRAYFARQHSLFVEFSLYVCILQTDKFLNMW